MITGGSTRSEARGLGGLVVDACVWRTVSARNPRQTAPANVEDHDRGQLDG